MVCQPFSCVFYGFLMKFDMIYDLFMTCSCFFHMLPCVFQMFRAQTELDLAGGRATRRPRLVRNAAGARGHEYRGRWMKRAQRAISIYVST